MSSMDDALVQTYCMESGDMGFIVYSSQLLVSFFKECELVQASSLPTLSDGQAFQVSVRALLDLSVDAISLVDSSPALQALGCRGATFDGKIGLGSIKNEDIGITMPSFKSFINCLGHSQYFNHLLAEEFQNVDVVGSTGDECLFLNLANLVYPTYCPLRKVKTADLLHYPMSPQILACLASAATSCCPASIKDGKYHLSIFNSGSSLGDSSDDSGRNLLSNVNKHIRFSTIQGSKMASAPPQEETVTHSSVIAIAKPSKSAIQTGLSIQSLSKPPLGRVSVSRVLPSFTGMPPSSHPPKTSNARQMHQLQLSEHRGRAVQTPSGYSEAYTTPESSFDFTPSQEMASEFEKTGQVTTRSDVHDKQFVVQTTKIVPRVIARSSPSKAKTPASAIASFSSLKSPPTTVQRGPSSPKDSPKDASPSVPFHHNPSSIYEDENIMNLLFATPFEIKFRSVFKYLKSYGWQERNVSALWKHGAVFLRPHCLNSTADYKQLKKDEDFFVTETAANNWLLRDFHTNAEVNVQAFKARYNILPPSEITESAIQDWSKKKRKNAFSEQSKVEEDYFVATENSPESQSGNSGTQGSTTPNIAPNSEFEDWEIINLLFNQSYNKMPVFPSVFKFLRSYNWTYGYGKADIFYYRPHCQTCVTSKGKIDRNKLMEGQDYFLGGAATESWLRSEIKRLHPDLVAAAVANEDISTQQPPPKKSKAAPKSTPFSTTAQIVTAHMVSKANRDKSHEDPISTPESASTVSSASSLAADEFQDPKIIKYLFDKSSSKKPSFQRLFSLLRTYNWTYAYGQLHTTYLRPHCKGTADRKSLAVNKDYFEDEHALEKWLEDEISSRHPALVASLTRPVKGKSKGRVVSQKSVSSSNPSKITAKVKTSSTTGGNSEGYFAASAQSGAPSSKVEVVATFGSLDIDTSPLSYPADEFADAIIIDALFGQPASSKALFQKAFKYLRSYNWYYEWGNFASTYFRPHCKGKEMQNLVKGEDYFHGEDAAEAWLKNEIKNRHPSLVEAAKKGALKGDVSPSIKPFAVGKKIKQDKGKQLLVKMPSVSNSVIQTPQSSQASASYNLSDEFYDSPSDSSVFSELNGSLVLRREPPRDKKRHARARESWNETLDSDASITKEPKKKRRQLAVDSHCSVHTLKPLSCCDLIEINIEHKAYTHLPEYEGSVDMFMSRMLHCIDDDAFHNRHLPFPVPGRKKESIDIFLNIMQSMRSGAGKLLYVAGFPGGGKTQSLIVIVKFIESMFNQYSQPVYLDYLVQNKKRVSEMSSGYSSLSDTDAPIKPRQYCDKYMHFVRVNCVSLVDVDHLYELVNNEMGILSKKISNKREIREVMDSILLNTPALPCTVPLTRLEADAGHQFPTDFPESSATRGKLEFLPMLVLVLDEFDYVKTNKPAIYDSIMKWTLGRVLVLGSGNMMHAVMSTYVQSTTTLVFKAYDVPDLCSILQYRTGGLFNKAAQQMLALKVKERNNGDVRRLLGWAKSAMQLAWTTHKGGNAADPTSMEGFINLPHITRTEPQSFEAEQRKSLSVLTPQLRTLLVSFIVNNGIRFGFTFKQAYAYYNEYLAKYSLGHESMDTVKSGISNLLDYAMVTRLNPTAKADQAMFRVNLKEEELLNLDTNSLPEVQKNDIRRFMHQQKHLDEEETGGF